MKSFVLLKYCVCFIPFFFFNSCENFEKERMTRLVREWNGKKILFPINSVFTIQGNDTVSFAISRSSYKVVTHVDSIGCTSCKLQLLHWKAFMHDVDSLTKNSVRFMFYFCHNDKRVLSYITRRDAFVYPVCMDTKDEFNKLNHFPDDVAFHTLLLDSANRVVAIGDPIRNPKVKDLYLKILARKAGKKETIPLTTVSVSKTKIDFGSFPQSVKQEGKIILANDGNCSLVIQDIITSCGCTKVEYNHAPVKSGEALELTLVYEAEKPEHFNKTISIHCNVPDSPLRLSIVGDAK